MLERPSAEAPEDLGESLLYPVILFRLPNATIGKSRLIVLSNQQWQYTSISKDYQYHHYQIAIREVESQPVLLSDLIKLSNGRILSVLLVYY
jgi:hypothetical protein